MPYNYQMRIYCITGSAGIGKSTICKALKDKGYPAYDVDNDGLARWTNLKTGYVHPKSSVKPNQRTAEFIKSHGWFVPRSTIEEIKAKSDGNIGFIYRAIDNFDKLADLFSGVFALYVSDQTIKDRLSRRTEREWGAQPHELLQTLERHQSIYEMWRNQGANIIDASKPIDQLADELIAMSAAKVMSGEKFRWLPAK